MQCPHFGSNRMTTTGLSRGKQTYRCGGMPENSPTREELERLLAENDEAHRRLSELNAWPQIVASQSKCAGKPMLLIEYAARGDLRAIGEVLEQLEQDAGVALPCRFLNV